MVSLNRNVLIVNQNGDSWSLPKGHLDPGETDLQAAKREIYEEAGIKELDLVECLGTYERPRISRTGGDDPTEIKRITLFLFTTRQIELDPKDPHHPEARWVTPEEAVAMLTHPKDREFLKGHLSRIERERTKTRGGR